MKSLAKNSIYNIVYQLFNLLFPLISSMYVARILMADGVGKVAYAQNIATYFVVIAALGLPSYGLREIAKVKNNYKACSQTFWELLAINAISTTVASILYFILIVSVSDFRKEWMLYLCTGAIIWLNYANIDWFYQGKEEYGYITARSLVIKCISLIMLFIFVQKKEDYILYALITSGGLACNYLFNLFHARKYVEAHCSLKKEYLLRHMRPLFILGITIFLGTLYNNIDVTILGIMMGDSVVGYYSNAHKIILILVSCCIATTTVFMPRLSYYYEHDKVALYRLVNVGCKFLIVIVVPATIGVALLSEDLIILLYGTSFLPAGITLSLFAPMLLIRPVGDLLCYQLLISAGEEKKRFYASIVAIIVNILLNVLLIPLYKQNGAAVASVITEFVINGLLLKVACGIVQIHLERRFWYSVLIPSIVMLLTVLMLKHFLQNGFVFVMCSTFLGGILYIAVGMLLKNCILIQISLRIKRLLGR